MMKKKGQEEIVGFVLIMIIVAVVLLVFLGITIRKDGGSKTESREIYQFLESSMEYTTDCAIRFESDFVNLGELFDECNSESNCLNGEKSCDALNKTLIEIFDSSWRVGPENPIKAYKLDSIYRRSDTEQTDEIISFAKGNCTNTVRGSSYVTPSFPGKIEISLELCY